MYREYMYTSHYQNNLRDGVVYGEETAPRYEYDYNAKGQVARVRDNLLNRTTQSEYDLANRPVRVKTAEAGQHVYTGQVAYDNVYGNLSEFAEKVGENRQEYGTKFGYDDENRPTSLTYSASGKEIGQSTTTIDKLNRTTFSAVKLGSKPFTSEYHFAAGGYGTGSVTNLVASITQPGCNCGYGYDDNGNIASATLNGKWTGYTYDALGQLVQVNDHSDTRSGSDGTTWKYTYDLGGNILKKERFAYADTTNPLETVTYTYGDANWRDKLTAVNGSTIRYDAIGNPLSDGTWTYIWQNGRQLQKMQKAGVTAEFVYNADGLRVQKTVNGVATKYTLHGKNVVHMTSGADELHFFYDAQNRPAVVVYNGVPYAYVKSLQGDVIALLDGTGNVVVSYVYDAWGAPIGKSGSMAETLGTVQPFRYRGYVFDEETGLYYLRSRYYNPRWGRFVNADGAIIQKNLFAYCSNGPIVGYDPSGFERVKLTPHRSDSSEKYPDSVMSVDLFVELIKQAVETEGWKYIYGHARWKETDCVGLPKYVLEWYYSHKSFKKLYQITKGENKGEILNQVKDLAVYGMQNGETFDITDWDDIPIGAAVFKYDPTNPEATKENKGWLHVGVYIGITEEYGYTIAAAASKKDGVGYFPLTDEYTKWGYFNGVSYD